MGTSQAFRLAGFGGSGNSPKGPGPSVLGCPLTPPFDHSLEVRTHLRSTIRFVRRYLDPHWVDYSPSNKVSPLFLATHPIPKKMGRWLLEQDTRAHRSGAPAPAGGVSSDGGRWVSTPGVSHGVRSFMGVGSWLRRWGGNHGRRGGCLSIRDVPSEWLGGKEMGLVARNSRV